VKIRINKYRKNQTTSKKPYVFRRGGHSELIYIGWLRFILTIELAVKL